MNHITLHPPLPQGEVALLSIDNTQGFENKSLNELYVNEGEEAAKSTKQIVDLCKKFGIQIINVFDNHPVGHVLFAANYKNKNPYDIISFDEIKNWTEQDNGIGNRAKFSLQELKNHLSDVGSEVLWPDHCIKGTQGASLMHPLTQLDFDIHIPKGEKVVNSGYSGFDHTNLNEILKKGGKKILLLTGVATDYCVGQTALDAKNLGYEPYIIQDAVRGVTPDTTEKMVEKLKKSGVSIITQNDLFQLLNH